MGGGGGGGGGGGTEERGGKEAWHRQDNMYLANFLKA